MTITTVYTNDLTDPTDGTTKVSIRTSVRKGCDTVSGHGSTRGDRPQSSASAKPFSWRVMVAWS